VLPYNIKMRRGSATFAAVAGLAFCEALGGITTSVTEAASAESNGRDWRNEISISTYFGQNTREFVNPTITADREWLHLEARYNYEALKTASTWLGYKFSMGEELELEFTPMLGGVVGDITGIAPGYEVWAKYKRIEFYTEGEYFIDAAIHAGNFFYTWSELSYAPVEWLKVGVVIDRTKVIDTEAEIRRGPMIAYTRGDYEFKAYWLQPGSYDSTVVFAVQLEF